MTAPSPLQPVLDLYQKWTMLNSVSAVLGWDQETYMPSGAIGFRSSQLSIMSELSHQVISGHAFKDALNPWVDLHTGAISPNVSAPLDRQMIELAYKEWKVATALPSRLVTELSEATSIAQFEWQAARKENNFARFYPKLDRVVQLTLEKINAVGYATSPYDALLDPFEPGMTVQKLTPLFNDLKKITVATLARQRPQDPTLPTGPFDHDAQRIISNDLLHRIGFDLSKGRLDVSTHPFSSAFHPTDSRITTRFNSANLMDNISSTLHEAGHGLYEQGLPVHHFGTPLGTSLSLGIHESQSRLWENMVGKSAAFWEGYFPIVCDQFPELSEIGWETFYHAINQIAASEIRVDADEVTYNLHIMLRFELEQSLLSGEISTQDLPSAWNQKMWDLLGIHPKTDQTGVLQDVHWSLGAFGYFPTYSLGNLYAAQFFEAAENAIPNLTDHIKALHFAPLKEWLRRNIHEVGRTLSAEELIVNVSGSPLSTAAFERYIQKKYPS